MRCETTSKHELVKTVKDKQLYEWEIYHPSSIIYHLIWLTRRIETYSFMNWSSSALTAYSFTKALPSLIVGRMWTRKWFKLESELAPFCSNSCITNVIGTSWEEDETGATWPPSSYCLGLNAVLMISESSRIARAISNSSGLVKSLYLCSPLMGQSMTWPLTRVLLGTQA